MLGRPAAGLASGCNLLRRRPRKRADPGPVADSDVVGRTKTERGGSPRRGAAAAEFRKLPADYLPSLGPGPILPAPSVVVWAGECLLFVPPPPHRGFSWGVLRRSRAAVAAAEPDCWSGSVVPRPGWRLCTGRTPLPPTPRPPAMSETERLQFAFRCRKPYSGLGRKVDDSPGWFSF